MSPTVALRQFVRVVSDATGRSPEEVWLLAAAAAAVAVSVAAARGVVWVFDLVNDLEARPVPARRVSGEPRKFS
jgi:hypothetical protein